MPTRAADRYRTGLYGIVGRNISYTQSPFIFRAVFRELGWSADYGIFDIAARELPSLLAAMRRAPIRGLNVTVPYKQTVMPLLDVCDPSARQVGAVNTIALERGRLVGVNTDIAGVVAALGPHRARLRGGEAVIFGAGGGARATAAALIEEFRMARVTIAARHPAAARRLIHDLQDRMSPAHLTTAAFAPARDLQEALLAAALVVNATPVGTAGTPATRLLPRGTRLRSATIAFDLVYRPRPTLFAREARAAGCRRIIDGWPMLIAQAEAAFRRWTGRAFPVRTRTTLLRLPHLP
ncbi:MAG TPA: shikimate dehydrogenase [bacterium]|nr:shikimate dehydrogenase [bacterium]